MTARRARRSGRRPWPAAAFALAVAWAAVPAVASAQPAPSRSTAATVPADDPDGAPLAAAEDADPGRPPTLVLVLGAVALAAGSFVMGRRRMPTPARMPRHLRLARHARPGTRRARTIASTVDRLVGAPTEPPIHPVGSTIAAPALPTSGNAAGGDEVVVDLVDTLGTVDPVGAGHGPAGERREVTIDLTDATVAHRAVAHLLASLAGLARAGNPGARTAVRGILDALADVLRARPPVAPGQIAALATSTFDDLDALPGGAPVELALLADAIAAAISDPASSAVVGPTVPALLVAVADVRSVAPDASPRAIADLLRATAALQCDVPVADAEARVAALVAALRPEPVPSWWLDVVAGTRPALTHDLASGGDARADVLAGLFSRTAERILADAVAR